MAKPLLASVSQGSVLGPLLFLIYINDLLNGIESICKIFADDTLLFSVVNDDKQSQSIRNKDLESIAYINPLSDHI